jgi:FkbM family methyltransferase
MAGLIHVGAWDGREYVGETRRLMLFEPQQRPFRELMGNLSGKPGVVLINAAAGATKGRATMYRIDPDHSSSLIRVPAGCLPTHVRANGEEQVRLTTVDDEVAHFDLRGFFDEMRVDTQGYELEVLRGARVTLGDLDRVECELHDGVTYPGAATAQQLDAYLEAVGFARVSLTAREGDDPVAVYERQP